MFKFYPDDITRVYGEGVYIKMIPVDSIAPHLADFFPLKFYNGSITNIVGIIVEGDIIRPIKYYTTDIRAINRLREMDANLLGSLVPQKSTEFLYEVDKGEFLSEKSFSGVFPPKEQNFVLAFSPSHNQLICVPTAKNMGVLIAFYLAGAYLKNPGYKGFTPTAKRFLYNWACMAFNYPYNEHLGIERVEFPSNGRYTEVSLPPQKHLAELTNISKKMILEPQSKGVEKEGEQIVSLLELIHTGKGIEERLINNSHKITLVIDIDAPSFEFVTSAYIQDKGLVLTHDKFGTNRLRDFYNVLGWKSTDITAIQEDNILPGYYQHL